MMGHIELDIKALEEIFAENRGNAVPEIMLAGDKHPPILAHGLADLEFIDEDIRVYDGRTAIWITRSVRRDTGGSSELHFRGTDVLVKIGGRWRWASVHSTRVVTPPVK